MNADALSDLVLLLVCGTIVWFHRRERPALAIDTGEFTGRSPKDKFTVKDAKTEGTVWWGDVNIPMTT